MLVLAHDHGAPPHHLGASGGVSPPVCRVGGALPLGALHARVLGHGGVHGAHDVRVRQRPAGLVLHRAGRVKRAHGRGHGLEVGPVPRLVAQRPHDDAGVASVSRDHTRPPRHERASPPWALCEHALILLDKEAVCLHVGLVHDVEAEGVADIVPLARVGVVRCAHGVEVELLEQARVFEHQVPPHRLSPRRTVVVAVHAAHRDSDAIDEELRIADAHLAHAHPPRLPVRHLLSAPIPTHGDAHHQAIQPRRFRRPQPRRLKV
mmetsp:Transcript_5813/g.16953  ORF Transcript_5813/g.16953 Transcript_5813/m.16953 type:complete len:263 (-) Transcript_5813:1221-2009(-)